MTIRFAFKGRVSTEDQQDPEASRIWQRGRAQALVERHGEIVAEFFDIGESRSLPWKRRPQAAALLAALKDPDRGFDAVVIGEPQRAFYGNQYGLTFPIFVHYGVQLWVPEVGGPIDPESEAHDLVMSVFGGMSKGERNRLKIRVRAAMKAQTEVEGRFLGGRPPYGYLIADAGPHPNPAKAADGKRLHRLEADPVTAPIVRRIFIEYANGRGRYAIAEGLNRDGIPCPSAHDRARNPHRSGVGWSKSAIRAILGNPRYTGRQVWNKQRTDEVLLDVDDVGLGHITKQRWNAPEAWVWSDKVVHELLIEVALFDRVQEIMAARGADRKTRERTKTHHRYVLRGLVYCELCGRRMQGQQTRGELYYRCRYANEYALVNHVQHPRNVYLAERELLGPLDHWLAASFAPHRLEDTINSLFEAQAPTAIDPGLHAAERTVADCDEKLRRYRAALDAGADPALVTQWIAEVQAQKAVAHTTIRTSKEQAAIMTREEISMVINQLGDIRSVLTDADPDDKAEVYQRLGLKLTYQPGKRTTRAEVVLDPWGYGLCPRGDSDTWHGEISPDWGSHTGYATTRTRVVPPWYGVESRGLAACLHCGVETSTALVGVAGVLFRFRVRVLARCCRWNAVPLGKSSLHVKPQTTCRSSFTMLPTTGYAAAQCQQDRAGADPPVIGQGWQTAPHQGPQGLIKKHSCVA
ncbi:DNA invertase Pin-like site-specific DNA recombinase [Kibdelosporangium banguiense]|uniref:DNA invertase Pin-like site-specific DNA recombinase n=1 Tax=Kibdelosporangium banguiense TaxID=1365924 RepID=A0ABS4U057_9PSEU|nr:recombinase family protein [Kibdelosporangium banguiense]MBP2329546.1 DNA invertase Pin-like site-specific DNA recombinase [Kibdelosporangium banguiense]